MIRRLLKEFEPLAWPFAGAIILVQLSVILGDEIDVVSWFVLILIQDPFQREEI